jgi:hypothetical protein
LTELGIDEVVAEKKEHNGKVEAFNARSCSIIGGGVRGVRAPLTGVIVEPWVVKGRSRIDERLRH